MRVLDARRNDAGWKVSLLADLLPPAHTVFLTLQEFITQLEAAATECGLRLKRLDKKSEKAVLAAQKARLLQLLAPEGTPATALALAVPLLVLQHKHKLLSVPGRGISTVLQQLSGQLFPAAFEFVSGYHESVVESLKLQSGAGGEGQQQERKLGQLQQQLEEKLPVLKALVGLGDLPPELKAGAGETAAAAAAETSTAAAGETAAAVAGDEETVEE